MRIRGGIKKHGRSCNKRTDRLSLREGISLVPSIEDSSGIIHEVRTVLLEIH